MEEPVWLSRLLPVCTSHVLFSVCSGKKNKERIKCGVQNLTLSFKESARQKGRCWNILQMTWKGKRPRQTQAECLSSIKNWIICLSHEAGWQVGHISPLTQINGFRRWGVIPKCQPIAVLKPSLIATLNPLFPILISHLACHRRVNTEQGWRREREVKGASGVEEGGRLSGGEESMGESWVEEEERIWLKQQVEIQQGLKDNTTKRVSRGKGASCGATGRRTA